MYISKKTYIVGGGISFLLVVLITLIIIFTKSSDDKNPPTNPPMIDPDEVPLPFTHALIVKINNSALWARDIDGESSMFLFKNWTTPFHSFDFYHKKNIYFGSTETGGPITSYSKRFSQLTQPGTWFANQIAVDHVHEKVYVLDGLAAKVNVFDIQSGYCNIISVDLNQPKDIDIDPIEKFLFILQLSSILKTNLDGASPKNILERADILAFQIDVDQKRIYWATPDDIQSVDYEGQNCVTVEKISSSVVSLAVSNNNLFWINPSNDHKESSLWFCKITGGVCKDTSTVTFDDNAVEIKAYNFEKAQVYNPCKRMTNCEHMCVNSNNEPRCACNIGWQLKSDSQSCESIDNFLMYVQGDFVKGRVLDFSKDTFVEALLPFKVNFSLLARKHVLDFDFDARNREMVFSDDSRMSKISLKSNSPQISMGGSTMEKKLNPAVDWIAKNVYFVRLIYRDFFDIAVQNIKPYDSSTADIVIYKISDQQTPTSLVVHPNRGFLFFILLNDLHKEQVNIVRANLDGTNRTTIGKNLSISNVENGLAIDYEEDRLFWFDKSLEKVHSADLECSNLQTIDVSIVENPKMINVYGDYVYISNLTSIWRLHKKTGQDILKILPTFGYESQSIRGAKVFSAKSQVIESNHPCAVNNGGCKRYCFAKPKANAQFSKTNELEMVCGCNGNEKLDADGKNCIAFS